MFLLDTDVLSALAKRRRDPHVERWLARRRDDELFLSVVSVGEIERGIAMQRERDAAFAEALLAMPRGDVEFPRAGAKPRDLDF